MTLYNEKKQSVLYLIRNFKLIHFITFLERKSKYTNKQNSQQQQKCIKGNEKHKNIKPRKQMSGILHLESCAHTNLTFFYSNVTRFQFCFKFLLFLPQR